MNAFRQFLTGGIAVLALAGSFLVLAAPKTPGDCAPVVSTEDRAARRDAMRERVHTRLERMAQQLEITAGQQHAWAQYAAAVENLRTSPAAPTAATDTNAATVARSRAERATLHAQKMSQLADTTAQLQQVLNPDQRNTLDTLTRQHGFKSRHDGHRAERGGNG
jgi:cell pole-organizing protein PopZ